MGSEQIYFLEWWRLSYFPNPWIYFLISFFSPLCRISTRASSILTQMVASSWTFMCCFPGFSIWKNVVFFLRFLSRTTPMSLPSLKSKMPVSSRNSLVADSSRVSFTLQRHFGSIIFHVLWQTQSSSVFDPRLRVQMPPAHGSSQKREEIYRFMFLRERETGCTFFFIEALYEIFLKIEEINLHNPIFYLYSRYFI